MLNPALIVLVNRIMIKPAKNNQSYSPDNGDILYGSRYVLNEVKIEDAEHMDRLPICFYNTGNPWISLPKRLGIDADELKKAVEYDCPYTKNKYYWILPTYLVLTSNTVKYYNGKPDDFEFDIDWWKRSDIKPNSIQLALLGHGYTNGTLPCDGSGAIKLVLVSLDNGDALLCYCWIWYNK
jgi:hypothetical protein